MDGGRTRLPADGGSWGKAIQVPGSGPDDMGGNADVATVSCTSPGNCVAGTHEPFTQD